VVGGLVHFCGDIISHGSFFLQSGEGRPSSGAKIPEEMLPNLFMPIERGGDRPSREGLGLGLFIAPEIAKGHDGTLTVTSTDEKTAFSFQIPNTAEV
jgi:signal transduction histidine kinase